MRTLFPDSNINLKRGPDNVGIDKPPSNNIPNNNDIDKTDNIITHFLSHLIANSNINPKCGPNNTETDKPFSTNIPSSINNNPGANTDIDKTDSIITHFLYLYFTFA